MVILRFMFIVMAIATGFFLFGCSQSHSPDSAPPADQKEGQASAEGSKRAQGPVMWWRDESIVAELELSDDQVRTIDELMAENSGGGDKQRQQERQLTLRYLRTLNQEPYNAALADQLGQKLLEALSSEHRRRIERIRALRDILTHEQWTKMWDVAPRALQIGRFRIALGPKIAVTDDDSPPAQKP